MNLKKECADKVVDAWDTFVEALPLTPVLVASLVIPQLTLQNIPKVHKIRVAESVTQQCQPTRISLVEAMRILTEKHPFSIVRSDIPDSWGWDDLPGVALSTSSGTTTIQT